MPVPFGHESSWTIIHAITRQESQFAQGAISHAGARGLMQLMPGTAREQSGKANLSYNLSALTDDPQYNIRLGSGYIQRMMDYYGGSYPLAVAAYNAGPGNVNKWLRANGDPRMGGIDWVKWIEEIPISETRNYVKRVLENAVVYDTKNPRGPTIRSDTPLTRYIGKNYKG
jgi:soluble lytic murein transglycosylase